MASSGSLYFFFLLHAVACRRDASITTRPKTFFETSSPGVFYHPSEPTRLEPHHVASLQSVTSRRRKPERFPPRRYETVKSDRIKKPKIKNPFGAVFCHASMTSAEEGRFLWKGLALCDITNWSSHPSSHLPDLEAPDLGSAPSQRASFNVILAHLSLCLLNNKINIKSEKKYIIM